MSYSDFRGVALNEAETHIYLRFTQPYTEVGKDGHTYILEREHQVKIAIEEVKTIQEFNRYRVHP